MTVTVQQTVILYRPTTNIYFSPLITPPVSRSTPPPADQLICERGEHLITREKVCYYMKCTIREMTQYSMNDTYT